MNVLIGDIGNTITKICVIEINSFKILKTIYLNTNIFFSKNFLKKALKKIFKKKTIYKVALFSSVVPKYQKILEIFLKKEHIAFVQMGSSAEYGDAKSPHKENAKCNPKSVYGQAKLLSSIYLIDLFKKQKFPSTILRLYNTYGPRQDLNRFIPIVISGCIKNEKFPCSKGNQLRDFLHIDDVVDAILKSLTNKNAKGQIINIGSGKPRIIKNIIEYIKKILKGGYPLFGKVKLRKDEILKVYPDINKAKNKINWKPKISFKKGLKVTIDSFK